MKRAILRLYERLFAPILKTISKDFQSTRELAIVNRRLTALLEDQALTRIETLKSQIRATAPDNLALQGYKVYSQNDEDGIIAAIFRKLGLSSSGGGSFIEIGCGDGLQNNTHALALSGWRGAWVDGSVDNIARINQHHVAGDRLIVEHHFVTSSNIGPIVRELLRALAIAKPDFLSLDIDGNDYYVMDALLHVTKPRVICIEYNAKFPYPLDIVMPYDESYVWRGDDYFGASLASLVRLLEGHGYVLLTCSLSGVNAFFVSVEEAKNFTLYPAAELYQPARFYLQHAPAAHPPSLKFLEARTRGRA